MVDHVSRLPDELLLEISFTLGRKDRLNFACTNKRIFGSAIEAPYCDIGLIPQYLLSWYISRISQNRKWARKVRHLQIQQSRHDALCYLSHGTVQGCRRALDFVLHEYPSSKALVQEIEDILGTDMPYTTTQDASSLCLLLLMVLGNVEQLTLMLHPDPAHHKEEPILEWDDNVKRPSTPEAAIAEHRLCGELHRAQELRHTSTPAHRLGQTLAAWHGCPCNDGARSFPSSYEHSRYLCEKFTLQFPLGPSSEAGSSPAPDAHLLFLSRHSQGGDGRCLFVAGKDRRCHGIVDDDLPYVLHGGRNGGQ